MWRGGYKSFNVVELKKSPGDWCNPSQPLFKFFTTLGLIKTNENFFRYFKFFIKMYKYLRYRNNFSNNVFSLLLLCISI